MFCGLGSLAQRVHDLRNIVVDPHEAPPGHEASGGAPRAARAALLSAAARPALEISANDRENE